MFEFRLPGILYIAASGIVAALGAGVAAGSGHLLVAFFSLLFSIYLFSILMKRISTIRHALQQLQQAVETLPEGTLPQLSTAPGVELMRLTAALEEMNMRVRERLAQLENDRNRLSAVFTSMRDAVITLGSSGRIVLINPAAERLFEVKAAAVVGQGVLQVIRHQKLARAMQDVTANGKPITLELETFDVPMRHFQADLAPVRSTKGELTGAVAVLHDVTQLRRLEEMRREFVANVSHELRTPITSIKGFLETLLDGAMDDAETCRRFLTILSNEANRLANLVNDLLDLSRLEAETGPVPMETVEVAEAIDQVMELMTPLAQNRRIKTEVHVERNILIKANKAMLHQALLNLLDNAIKYTPEDGRVWITVEAREAEGLVDINVHDTGPGIPSSHLNRLFDRFYRVDKARSRSVGGTGLGLAIVRLIAERHGGKVKAASTVGKGSTFTLTLRAAPRPPAAPNGPAGPHGPVAPNGPASPDNSAAAGNTAAPGSQTAPDNPASPGSHS